MATLTNPLTGRVWGAADAEILRAAGFGSPDWATFTQWAKAGETIAVDAAPCLVAFTRGDARAPASTRLYPVWNREQLASSAAIEAPRYAPQPRRRRDEPRSLIPFLIRAGGIQDIDGDLKAMDLHRRYIGLVRVNGGRYPDMARELAEEAHYLKEGCTVADLYDALAEENCGNKVFPWGCPF